MDEARAARLFRDANGARWDLPPAAFAEALDRSVAKAFAGRTPSAGRDSTATSPPCTWPTSPWPAPALRGHEGAWDHFVAEYRPALYRAADAVEAGGGARDVADALYAELFGIKERDGRAAIALSLLSRPQQPQHLAALTGRPALRRPHPRGQAARPHPRGDFVRGLAGAGGGSRPGSAAVCSRDAGRARGGPRCSWRPRDRLRLGCYYAQEMTLAQIGRLTGEHEATVSRHLSRTRREIRSLVERGLRDQHGFGDREISECFASISADAGSLDLADWLDPEDERKKAGADRSKPEDSS